MVLDFHMQHDEAEGLQNDEIQPCGESKMPTVAKNTKTIKLTFSPEPHGVFG